MLHVTEGQPATVHPYMCRYTNIASLGCIYRERTAIDLANLAVTSTVSNLLLPSKHTDQIASTKHFNRILS